MQLVVSYPPHRVKLIAYWDNEALQILYILLRRSPSQHCPHTGVGQTAGQDIGRGGWRC